MDSILANEIRIGRFTSSEIWKLMTNGKGPEGIGAPALTYIKKKRNERLLMRPASTGGGNQATAWGHFCEHFLFDTKLGIEYTRTNVSTKAHPVFPNDVAGSCDLWVQGDRIGEIKCYQPENFAEYSQAIIKQDVDVLRSEFPEEYWQCVNNAAIYELKKAEVICFMPSVDDLEALRHMAENWPGEKPWQYRFIYENEWYELPILPKASKIPSLNRFVFEIPESDFEALTNRIKLAIKLLNE